MFVFVFAGFSVLFRSIEVDGIVRFKDGTYAVAGESKRLRFERRYAHFELPVLEICKKLDARRRIAELPAADSSALSTDSQE